MKINLEVLHIICKQTDTHRHIKYIGVVVHLLVADEPKIINIAPPTLKFLKPVANRTRREETCLKITYLSHFQMLEVPVTMKIHMNFISYHYT
jgi:hypothetical protein